MATMVSSDNHHITDSVGSRSNRGGGVTSPRPRDVSEPRNAARMQFIIYRLLYATVTMRIEGNRGVTTAGNSLASNRTDTIMRESEQFM